ncbi:hypothetical protein [Acinetobacter nosocomialis]|uniref:hypothetical protein n=1 Tax=Acinetobacter nosocomialis TaxID=106654 RepID=UPI0033A0418D
MRVIIGVPHCRFVINKPKEMETVEFFAIHKQDQKDAFIGIAVKVVQTVGDDSIHTMAEIVETYKGLSYSKLAEKVKNLSKTTVRQLVDEMSNNDGPVTPVTFEQSRFGREAANIYEGELLQEVKSIFKNEFAPIRSELSELILGVDEFAAYKGVQGSW